MTWQPQGSLLGGTGGTGVRGTTGTTGTTGASGPPGDAATRATSTTSLILGMGMRYPRTQPNLPIRANQHRVRLTNAANISQWMEGTVTTYNASTGRLDVNIDRVSGSGTFANWNIEVETAFPIVSTGDQRVYYNWRAPNNNRPNGGWEGTNLNVMGGLLGIAHGGTNSTTAKSAAFALGLGGAYKHLYSGTQFDFPASFDASSVSFFLVMPAPGATGFTFAIGGTTVPASGAAGFSLVTAFRTGPTSTLYRVLTVTETNTVVAASFTISNAGGPRRWTSTQQMNVFGTYLSDTGNY